MNWDFFWGCIVGQLIAHLMAWRFWSRPLSARVGVLERDLTFTRDLAKQIEESRDSAIDKIQELSEKCLSRQKEIDALKQMVEPLKMERDEFAQRCDFLTLELEKQIKLKHSVVERLDKKPKKRKRRVRK